MQWSQFISFIISMLAITNPAGSVAVFLGMTQNKTEQEKRKIALVTTLTIFIVLVLITWTGIPILEIFGISLPAFEIAGGLIILLRGLEMLHSKETPTSKTAEELEQQNVRESIAVVPLGIPIIAGPGAMTNTVIFTREFPEFTHKIYICAGILFVSLVIGVMLFFSTRIGKIVGESGIKIMTRIMGLLLSAIAMSLMIKGLQEIFPGWT
ncbi:MAG TPA: MarC family protein [Gammaproteobacteria bacterium]|nr:MarC family protein [Gammaproteobacteria bacterium]